MKVHILGICGTLMGSIAQLAQQLGHEVEGSDENVYPPMSDQLREAGIIIKEGLSAEHLEPAPDVVIVGNANLPRGNPAIEAILDRRLPFTSGAEWLGKHLLADRWVIAVAGTHGKTTTTAMVAWILEYAGLNPGFLIGGIPGNFDVSARVGDDPFFVIEADEYDTSYFDRRSKFLHYYPRTAILNNLEYDHADIFPDLASIQNQFHLLVRTIPSSGLIIHPANDENLLEVIKQGCWTPTETLSSDSGATRANGWSYTAKSASEFDVYHDGDSLGTVHWQLSGDHNRQNALAAIAAARHVGVPPAVAIEALASFKGVKRRMEVIYESDRLRVYDDFAHHPTAIRTTLAGLKEKFPGDKILAVIEPASHTMRGGTHEHTLADSASLADHVLWAEPANVNWPMSTLLASDHGEVIQSHDQLLERILALQSQFQQIIIMSNGGFGGLHRRLVEQLLAPEHG